jgi:hypothetical protein
MQLTIRETEPQRQNLLQKAVSYVKAEVSAIVSSISDGDVERRLEACRNCPQLMMSPKEGEVGWCKACGCGNGGRAELTVKTKMPAAKCPLNKWP